MQPTSKAALAAARDELESVVSDSSTGDLGTVGSELYAVAGALAAHIELRRYLIDASASQDSRVGLVDGVFSEKIGEPALRVLRTLVTERPSTPTDLLEAVETLGRDATLAAAEKQDSLHDLEDELFRFGRILEAEPQLRTLLADTTATEDKRLELLHSVTGDKLSTLGLSLVEQIVRRPTTRAVDRAVGDLAEAAAARRDRSIARVTAPVVLSDDQENRLAETLSNLYGRSISVQSDVDPDLIGGLVVRVGGELIDGSIAGRLRAASTSLPG